MTAVAADVKTVEIFTFKLPEQLARHTWRLACKYDELRRKQGGASESGLMEVALEGFLSLTADENFALLERTFTWRGMPTEYQRKSYSLPLELMGRWNKRVNDLKDLGRARKVRISQWLCTEAAQIYLAELSAEKLEAAMTKFDVRKKRV